MRTSDHADAPTARVDPSAAEQRSARLALAVVATGAFFAFIDISAVNVAFPVIQESFPTVGLHTLTWLVDSYAIVVAAFVLVAGRFADVVGVRRAYCFGLLVFVVASVACAVAPSAGVLIAGRAVQGFGAALIGPAGYAIVLRAFPDGGRVAAIAAITAAAAAATGLGPLIGGVLTEAFGWRAIFVINIPAGLIVLVLAITVLSEWRDAHASRPDLFGAVLVCAALACIAGALLKADEWGWGSAQTLGLGAGGIALAVLAGVRTSRAASPIVEPEVLRAPLVISSAVVMGVFSIAFFGMLFAGSLFLTGVWGYSALANGAALAPCPITGALVARASVRLAQRLGPHVAALLGSLLFAAGAVLLAVLPGPDPDFLGAWLPGMVLTGIGMGLVLPVSAGTGTMALPPDRLGAGSSVSFTARQGGAVLGFALVAALLGRSGTGDLSTYDGPLLALAGAALVSAVAALGLRPRPRPVAPAVAAAIPSATVLEKA